MRRYWVDKKYIQNESVELSGDVFHHICDVCRQTVGSRFEILGLESQCLLVEITEKSKKSAVCKIISRRAIPPLPYPHIHLALSIPKPQVLDSVLERAVELGVSSVHLFFSDFSFFREPSEVLMKKKNRWDKIVLSATQQCGRGELMPVFSPTNLVKIFEKINLSDAAMGLFSYEGEANFNLRDALRSGQVAEPRNIWVFVGSEGGFSQQEVLDFKSRGFEPITLGEQVLRVETACLALVSVIKYEYELMK